MNLKKEIEFYCSTPNPVGALLLTGEWGCGKTYFIEHDLKEWIASKVVIVKVSLFGMSMSNEIHKAIKSAYLETLTQIKIHGDFPELFKKGKIIINGFSSIIPDKANKWLKLDLIDAIPLHNRLQSNGITKTVLLIFDDLERCNIKTADILGIINDYCENKGFHTLIVANQEKITTKTSNDTNSLTYNEMKEKLIQRTITYTPNYKNIIQSVISNIPCDSDEYREFLQHNSDEIFDLFASEYTFVPDDKTESKGKSQIFRPHNIRSLKCALNDFFRIYELLSQYKIEHPEIWLYNFISFVIAYKGNMIQTGSYGTLFTSMEVQKNISYVPVTLYD